MSGDPADDTVGYGRPPTATPFQPGRSGNLKGRPRKPKPRTVDVVGILDEPITVTQAGSARTMSAFEISVRKLVSKAVKNKDVPAMVEVLQLFEQYGAIVPAPPPQPSSGVLVIPRRWDRDAWMRMFERHGPPPWPGPRSGLCGANNP